ncbi:MAG TPA: DUF302 domain-containing protein [Pelomicrobium sp.]|nr:DUF302 domain-containing protein [Pelomicrobium sp.]
MRTSLIAALLLTATAATAAGNDGLVTLRSGHPPKQTLDRFEEMAKSKGMKIFARIDHAAGARSIGQELRPTELIIFGNPQGGTPLMQCAQSAGIDLPLKALAWQDASGQTWLAYNDPAWIAARHGAGECGGVPAKMRGALDAFAKHATTK